MVELYSNVISYLVHNRNLQRPSPLQNMVVMLLISSNTPPINISKTT